MSHSSRPIVLITGAGRRIGRALALDLAADGWRVAVHFNHSRMDADAVVREISEAGGEAAALQADLSKEGDVARLLPACAERLGAPVCLINNASEFRLDTLATMTPATWAAHLDVNLRTPLFLAQAFAAQLPVGREGSIINIIDQRVLAVSPEFFSYSISKSALWTATRMLAQELAPRIRVNAIGPGPTLRSVHQTNEDFSAESASTLLGRGTTPEEIAAAARFILASPALTGQLIALDGGQHLGWVRPPAVHRGH